MLLGVLGTPAYATDRASWLSPSSHERPHVGVQVKLQTFTAADAQRIHRAGFDFVRMGAWTDSMNQPGYRHALEEAIQAAHTAGLPVLLTVRSLKPLASPDAPPETRNAELGGAGVALANVVVRLADQFGSRLLAIELWNEPDLKKYWPTGDVELTFAPFMQAVCARLKAARPAVPMMGFAFARAPLAGSQPSRMLQPLAATLRTCINAISYHSYGMTPEQIRAAAQELRARYGLPAVVTEDGASSAGWNGDDRQVRRITTLLSAMDKLGIPLLSLYEWIDTPTGSDAAQRHYGLLYTDRVAKPALTAAEEALRGARKSPRANKLSVDPASGP